MSHSFTIIESPLGPLRLVASDAGLCGLYMHSQRHAPAVPSTWQRDDSLALFAATAAQLDGYFAGVLKEFDVPLALEGTEFQQRVWLALQTIGYGAVQTYAGLACLVGNAKAVRAVGLANGRNPVSIIVPCHRVVGSNGSLTGYGGGLDRKRYLLDLEAGRAAMVPAAFG